MASPYCAMTFAAHSGFSSAAVPRLMRLAPLSRAASREAIVADAARELDVDAVHLLHHAAQHVEVVAAAEGGVEVDEVDPLGALRRPSPPRPATGSP